MINVAPAARETFERAYLEQRWADAAIAADGVVDTFPADESAWFHVRAADACERAGRIYAAIRNWDEAAKRTDDPDAIRSWFRLMREAGRVAELQIDNAQMRYASDFRLRGDLGWGETQGRARLIQNVQETAIELKDRGRPTLAAQAWFVLGDLCLEDQNALVAVMAYRFGSRDAQEAKHPWLIATGLLREARADVATHDFVAAERKLLRLGALSPPPALEFPAQLAAVTAAVAADRVQRDAAAAAAFTLPDGIDLAGALEHAQAVKIERDGNFATIRTEGAPPMTFRVNVATASGTLDARRRCVVLPGVTVAPQVALLFGNGDLFVGTDGLMGVGYYLSAERPTTYGPCRFGIPLERATIATFEQVDAELRDGELRVVAKFEGGSGYIGGAVRDGDRLVPHGYGLLTVNERGCFVGRLVDGRPEEGGWLGNDGKAEFYSGGALVQEVVDNGQFKNGRTELDCVGGDSIEYFDRRNGVKLSWDRILFFESSIDLARLHREQERFELATEMENARRERERQAAAEPPAAAPSSESSFDFASELDSGELCCYRCKGDGVVYVAGSASQEMIWSATGGSDSRGGWVMGTVHRSGGLETCSRCGGSGLR